MQHPVDGKITQRFGENKVDFYKKLGMKGHNGIDYRASEGTPLKAPCDMTISNFYYENKDAGYGTTVFARSNPFQIQGVTYKVEMVFAHLQDFHNISLGFFLKRGEVFAFCDNTGKYTTGSHLHWGCRLVRKTWLGGWKTVDSGNGYKGYFDQEPLTSWSLNIEKYEGKIVKSAGPRHYLVRSGQLEWYEDEVAFACNGKLFSEAIKIDPNLIISNKKKTFKIDYNSYKTREVKQILSMLKGDPKRAEKLFNKYF